jgi:hypothetical protein
MSNERARQKLDILQASAAGGTVSTAVLQHLLQTDGRAVKAGRAGTAEHPCKDY